MGSQAVGAVAAAGAIFAFGTFGVPIKSQRLQASQVHPIVVQGYKSAACFGTCWLALVWAPLRFTWWGILGAAIWVMNGVAAVIAIQAAGLAVSQALWSGISIFVAFFWGTVVFREAVAIPAIAVAGLCLMACGIGAIGVVVSQRSIPSEGIHVRSPLVGICSDEVDDNPCVSHDVVEMPTDAIRHLVDGDRTAKGPDADDADLESISHMAASVQGSIGDRLSQAHQVHHFSTRCHSLRGEADAMPSEWQTAPQRRWQPSFAVGIGCAVLIGMANGSFMVPFKYASRSVTGLEFLISFGVGAAGVSLCSMVGYAYIARIHHWSPLQLKLRQAGPPALLAGLLWSCANLLSIIATQELGIAVAWPAVQMQLLVSTAWGALWYREIRDIRQGNMLLGATAVIIMGVSCLALAKGA